MGWEVETEEWTSGREFPIESLVVIWAFLTRVNDSLLCSKQSRTFALEPGLGVELKVLARRGQRKGLDDLVRRDQAVNLPGSPARRDVLDAGGDELQGLAIFGD